MTLLGVVLYSLVGILFYTLYRKLEPNSTTEPLKAVVFILIWPFIVSIAFVAMSVLLAIEIAEELV